MKQFKSIIAFKHNIPLLKGKLTVKSGADPLQDKLATHSIKDPTGGLWSQVGFLGNPAGDMYYANQTATFMYVAIRERILPGTVISAEVKRRAEKLAQRQGYACGRKQMAELRDDVEVALLPKSHIREVLIPIILRGDYLFVCTSSVKRADTVISLFVQTLELNEINAFYPIFTQQSPQSWMTELLTFHGQTDELTDTFSPGDAVTLEGSKSNNGTISFKDEDASGDRVTGLIENQDYVATKMRLDTDSMAFTMNANMIISSIKFKDVITDELKDIGDFDNVDERAAAEFDSSLTLASLEFAKLFDNLTKSMGGERTPANDDTDDQDDDQPGIRYTDETIETGPEMSISRDDGDQTDQKPDDGLLPTDPAADTQENKTIAPERSLTFWHDVNVDEYFYLRSTDEEPDDGETIQVTRSDFEMNGGDVAQDDDEWVLHGEPEQDEQEDVQPVKTGQVDEDDDEL